MSIKFREVCADGTPRQVLRALRDTKTTLDHEDLVLLMKNLLELVDSLHSDVEALKEAAAS